ncbi:WxcM-like domain-containing protein [Sphingobacterium sp. WM]|uniref:WxcM-like domain-containing protein n=1 Tax=Sphingobacterium sp. WM TaxID=3031802 RepID=UPI00240E206D|nr:WxcM-like domain-containing protein [Sphingobacterium sp. WM]WFB63277.1 WxcM-like domain-containing protein [Sphingobacterium sp. WM]
MYKFIQGGIAKDSRGQIRFVNDFDMKDVKRFYIIKNSDLELIRGWRAHKIEQRWFYVLSGSFKLSIVKIDNWENTDPRLNVENIIISSGDNRLIHLPAGFGTAFKALENSSELLVFADHYLEHSAFDDYTYPLEYFVNLSI